MFAIQHGSCAPSHRWDTPSSVSHPKTRHPANLGPTTTAVTAADVRARDDNIVLSRPTRSSYDYRVPTRSSIDRPFAFDAITIIIIVSYNDLVTIFVTLSHNYYHADLCGTIRFGTFSASGLIDVKKTTLPSVTKSANASAWTWSDAAVRTFCRLILRF